MYWTAYESTQLRPARNLAWEDALLEGRPAEESRFFLYRNKPCVVIGRNQNPWKEADPVSGFPVYRRKSGGGAVFQDEGNLNWSFIVPRDAWRVEDALDFVAAALLRLGLDLYRDPRGALFLDGRKVAGTARRYFGSSVLIHGTLLISTDLAALVSSLSGIEAAGDRAVDSVPSPVRNLVDAGPGFSVESVREALFAELTLRCGPAEPRDPSRALPQESWSDLEREHASWDWVYGSTQPFAVPLDGAGLFLRIRKGRVEGLFGEPDGSEANRLPQAFLGRPFDIELLRAVRGLLLNA